ncbi:MAG: hypothetical protein AAGA30_05940 [Planctomycetota bacterium]
MAKKVTKPISPGKRTYQQDSWSRQSSIGWILLTIFGWVMLVAGGSLYHSDLNFNRSLMILLPAILFALIWKSLLVLRTKKLR